MRSKKKISSVTQGKGNAQIFSSPKVTQPLPEIAGSVTVSFKHEDDVHGVAIGPVVVIATEPYDAWVKLYGSAHVNGRGETRHLIPFGSKPAGRYDLGWVTKLVAQEIATHYGVALKEF